MWGKTMFISQKTEKLVETARKLRPKLGEPEQKLFDELCAVMHELAAEVDTMALQMEELEDRLEQNTCNLESLNAHMQTVQDRIVGDIKVEMPDYGEPETEPEDGEHDECDCDDEDCHCHDDATVTLQCSFCEEIFMTDARTASTGSAVCPFCSRTVLVRDCLLD